MAGTFLDELRNAVRNAWCASLDTAYNFLDALPDPIVDSGSVPIARANRALYRMFCNNEPPPPPQPPFLGGQCHILYNVVVSNTYANAQGNPVNGTSSRAVWGKIKTAYWRFPTATTAELVLVSGTSSDPDAVLETVIQGGSYASPPPHGSFTVISITNTPYFGGADTCGDPDPVIEPPEPNYNHCPCNFTYTTNNNVDVNVSASLTFAPSTLNNYGDVTVPIRISLLSDNTIFGGDINLNTGDININFGNRSYPRSDREKPDSYDTPTDTPDVPPDVPTPVTPPSPDSTDSNTTRLLRACIVTVTNIVDSPTSQIFQEDNPDIFAPNLGYVQFLIAVGNRLAWSTDIPVKNRRHFIPCPWEGGALQVQGTPRAGVTWDISPVYTRQENAVEFDRPS